MNTGNSDATADRAPASTNACKPPPRFRKQELPDEFLFDHDVIQQCDHLIDYFMNHGLQQDEIDSTYTKFVDIYLNEMKRYMKEVGAAPKSKKQFKHKLKPYWNEGLDDKWKLFHESEKCFRKCDKKLPQYAHIKAEFLECQRLFDKELRCAKCSFFRRQVYELERANDSNPTEFWKFISKLGPKSEKSIPWEVLLPDGNIVSEHSEVLQAWRDAFHGLLTPPTAQSDMQKRHREDIVCSIVMRGNYFTSNTSETNEDLTHDFTIEEAKKVVMGSKNGKAPGFDGIIDEVLKNGLSVKILMSLFNLCLRSHITPTLWAKGVTSPIPKCAKNDPRITLNYRGISLLPVTSKLCTAAISHRLSEYLEKTSWQQNNMASDQTCLA